MAECLASAGADVMLVNRTAEDGKVAAQRLRSEYGIRADSFAADITIERDAEAMVKAAIETFGKVDILINSAGINIRGPIDEVSPDDFNKVMNVNVNGTWLCCRAVVPHMKYDRSGTIINMPSTLGLVGLSNRTRYRAWKRRRVPWSRALC